MNNIVIVIEKQFSNINKLWINWEKIITNIWSQAVRVFIESIDKQFYEFYDMSGKIQKPGK